MRCFTAMRKVYPEGYIPAYYKLRFRIMNVMGGRCSCCGDSKIEFLKLDTVDQIRVLCNNCYIATRNSKVCPHKNKSPILFIGQE